MKQYSFLNEASAETIIDMGDGKFSWDNFKKIFKNRKDIANSNAGKKIKGGVLAATSAYSYYTGIMNAFMVKKLTRIIHQLENPNITRKAASQLFVNLHYVKDDIINTGDGRVTSVSYELSSKVAGPAISMIFNEDDNDWRNTVINYLKRQRKFMMIKAGTQPVFGTLGAISAYKSFKK